MLSIILFSLVIAVYLCVSGSIILRLISRQYIPSWQFIVQAISLTAVITHIIGIW